MNNPVPLIVLALLLSIMFVAGTIAVRPARGGEKVLCHVEPSAATGWHYRTQVGGRLERCYYLGERMKPRHELYWAEAPKAPPMLEISSDKMPWNLEPRFRGAAPGWDHKE